MRGKYGSFEIFSELIEHLNKILDKPQDMGGVKSTSVLKDEVGGTHYKDMAIQPVEFIHRNNLGFIQGEIIAHLVRYKKKNGKEDLEKCVHYLQLLIELEYPNS